MPAFYISVHLWCIGASVIQKQQSGTSCKIFHGQTIASVQQNLPMICFTEINLQVSTFCNMNTHDKTCMWNSEVEIFTLIFMNDFNYGFLLRQGSLHISKFGFESHCHKIIIQGENDKFLMFLTNPMSNFQNNDIF